MIGPKTGTDWLGLVCDAASITVLAARGTGPDCTLVACHSLDIDPEYLRERGRIPALEEFVTEQQLAGCRTYVAFAGAGTVVERLHLPRLSRRNRQHAVRTRLMSRAAGRELAIAVRADEDRASADGASLLAAGVDCDLTRGIQRACRRAGLRVRAVTALAGAVAAPSAGGVVVQLLLGEFTTTIQLFNDRRLVGCRDVLLGRRDFVAAYQRPILTEDGAVTLSAAEAEEFAREVGIPVGREDEIRPGIPATQLWPTLNPVLQKLCHEVEQSLANSGLPDTEEAAINVLGVPALPGLGEFLADELQLQGPLVSPELPAANYLAALAGERRARTFLDLRPPEERLGDRLTRPALAIGVCALFVMFANSAAPREAAAQLAELRPLNEHLCVQLDFTRHEHAAAEQSCYELAARQQRLVQLKPALPPNVPVVAPLKELFASVPPNVELLKVLFQAGSEATSLELQAGYRGDVAASVVAARWARALSETTYFSAAKVAGVSGSGRDGPVFMEIRARLR